MSRHAPPAGAAVESLRIERRGGLAGLRACAESTLANLTPAQQAALGNLLRCAPTDPGAAPQPDRYHYRIRVGLADGAEQLLELPEEAMPEALASLIKPALG